MTTQAKRVFFVRLRTQLPGIIFNKALIQPTMRSVNTYFHVAEDGFGTTREIVTLLDFLVHDFAQVVIGAPAHLAAITQFLHTSRHAGIASGLVDIQVTHTMQKFGTFREQTRSQMNITFFQLRFGHPHVSHISAVIRGPIVGNLSCSAQYTIVIQIDTKTRFIGGINHDILFFQQRFDNGQVDLVGLQVKGSCRQLLESFRQSDHHIVC